MSLFEKWPTAIDCPSGVELCMHRLARLPRLVEERGFTEGALLIRAVRGVEDRGRLVHPATDWRADSLWEERWIVMAEGDHVVVLHGCYYEEEEQHSLHRTGVEVRRYVAPLGVLEDCLRQRSYSALREALLCDDIVAQLVAVHEPSPAWEPYPDEGTPDTDDEYGNPVYGSSSETNVLDVTDSLDEVGLARVLAENGHQWPSALRVEAAYSCSEVHSPGDPTWPNHGTNWCWVVFSGRDDGWFTYAYFSTDDVDGGDWSTVPERVSATLFISPHRHKWSEGVGPTSAWDYERVKASSVELRSADNRPSSEVSPTHRDTFWWSAFFSDWDSPEGMGTMTRPLLAPPPKSRW